MGLRGPAPKPTAIRVAQGNPGKRPLNFDEPRPLPVAPPCPRHLDADGRREWKRLVPVLLRMRVLTEADQHSLANLCQTYSTMLKAQEQLNKTGLLLKTPSGYVQQSPLLSIVNGCVDTITRLSREFGLTPAARTRVRAEPAIESMDELDHALCAGLPSDDQPLQ